MPIVISRNDLYERVWAEPIQKLSKEYGLSDVGLAKVCRRYNIPIPPRGYWAKKQAGKRVAQPPLAPQGPRGYVTGWRINSEVLPLQRRQVDLKLSEVRLDPGTTKNLEGRVFYLTSELKELLKAQRKAADRIQRREGMIVQQVFFHDLPTKAGDVGFWSGHAIAPSGFYHAWCRARIVAGCPGSIPHDFRRTAIRNMVRAGIPERVAMKLSGHKTRSVFDRYNVVSDGDLREASNRLGHSFGHSTASGTGRGKRNPQNR